MVGLEGCAAGMPVITTDAPPMNEYWSGDYEGFVLCETWNEKLLVAVNRTISAKTTNPDSVHNIVNLEDFSAKIEWCANNDLTKLSNANRKLAEELSWKEWKEDWIAELTTI
jgi:hypothetical protein